MRALPFLIREAFVNLRRHGVMTVAAISTLAVALTLCGAFALTFVQLRHLAGRSVDAFEMRVFCRTDAAPEALQATGERLRALPGVARVTFIPREQAFAEQTRNLPIDTQGIPNVFPHTFVVKLSDSEAAGPVAAQVRAWHGDIESVDVPETELRLMVRIAALLRNLGLVGGALLLAGALLVVMNTIRLSVFARQREIQIMRIVGATAGFIRLPMVIEGILHGLAGGLVAGGLLYLTGRAVERLTSQIGFLASNVAPVDWVGTGLWLTAGGVALGATGSLLALRRYLRIG